jgi:hypothetical protein
MSTASDRLRAKLELAIPAVRAASEQIWTSSSVRELYPVWLATMHGVVRSAVPLMETARARAEELAPDDPVAERLVPYLTHHAAEERGHDRWLLEDLEAAGGNPEEVLRRAPSPRVASLVGAQYYWIRHQHPVALLGHMAFVEGYPPEQGFAQRLRAATGHPSAAFRAIRRHERLDLRHREELFETVDGLPLVPEHETLLGLSALHTAYGAIEVFEEIHASPPAMAVVS